jgi:hypothetical protein
MTAPFTFVEAKSVLIEALTREAALHEARRFGELGSGFDEVDSRLPRDVGAEFSRLIFAHEFWAGWLDSCAHDWFHYEPIQENDWPNLARTVVADLNADRESTEPALLKHFSPRPAQSSLASRVLNRLRGRQHNGG